MQIYSTIKKTIEIRDIICTINNNNLKVNKIKAQKKVYS